VDKLFSLMFEDSGWHVRARERWQLDTQLEAGYLTCRALKWRAVNSVSGGSAVCF